MVDNVNTKYGNVKVIFIATDDGRLKKMATMPKSNETCLIEEIKIVPNGERKPVKAMRISSDQVKVYKNYCS